MAISPALLKGIAGLGAASTLTAGGVWWYTKKEAKYENIDEFVLNSKEGIWTIVKTTNVPDATNNFYEVTATLTGKNNNKDKTWSCKIKGTAQSPASGSSWNMEEQITSLKAEIGIKENQPRDFKKDAKFKKFFENCKKHKETESTYTIDLGDLELNNSSYRFENSIFQKIYEGEYWSQKLKEKQLNITCTGNSCSIIDNKQLEGFAATEGKTISITKSTQEDPDEFTDGIKYVIAETQSKNGNYKIDPKAGGGFALERVEDLTLEKLCKKVGLEYSSTTTPNCSIPTDGNGWVTSFYKDETNYAKGLKTTGISNVTINSSSGHKFTFTGQATFNTGAEGTISVEANKEYSVKYIPKLKVYAFVLQNNS